MAKRGPRKKRVNNAPVRILSTSAGMVMQVGKSKWWSWIRKPRFALPIMIIMVAAIGSYVATSHADTAGGPLSGMDWPSGVHTNNPISEDEAFGTWRGRAIDAIDVFSDQSTWGSALGYSDLGNYKAFQQKGGIIYLSEQYLPNEVGDWVSGGATCAAGGYNSQWAAIGNMIATQMVPDKTVVRLAWEFNLDDNFSTNPANAATFKQCFAQASTAIKTAAPGVQIAWNVAGGHGGADLLNNFYPGKQYADIIDTDWYDDNGTTTSQASFDAICNSAAAQGPCYFADQARQLGIKFAVGEWGLVMHGGPNGDNPAYVDEMVAMFEKNKDVLAYEGYYNAAKSAEDYNKWSGIWPGITPGYTYSVDAPNAGAEYKKLYSGDTYAGNPPTQGETGGNGETGGETGDGSDSGTDGSTGGDSGTGSVGGTTGGVPVTSQNGASCQQASSAVSPIPVPFRLDAGSDSSKPNWLDPNGNNWLCDQSVYLSGSPTEDAKGIVNGNDALVTDVESPYMSHMYDTALVGSDFSYKFPVKSGQYYVVMYFADMSGVVNQAQCAPEASRPFDVVVDDGTNSYTVNSIDLNGTAAPTDVGPCTAYRQVIPVTVADLTSDNSGLGYLSVEVKGENGGTGLLNGLQVLPRQNTSDQITNKVADAGDLIPGGAALKIEAGHTQNQNDLLSGWVPDNFAIEGDPEITQAPTGGNGDINENGNSLYDYARVGTGVSQPLEYDIPAAGGTTYNLVLYFNDPDCSAAGCRLMDVQMDDGSGNWTNLLSNFDIFTAAGGQNHGIAVHANDSQQTLTVTVPSDNLIKLRFNPATGTQQPPIVSGIELDPPSAGGDNGGSNGGDNGGDTGGGTVAGTTQFGGSANLSDANAYPTTPLIDNLPFAAPPSNAVLIEGNTAQAIKDAVNGHGPGTIFKLSPNTVYAGNSAIGAATVINPKSGDKFYGQEGSEIDGAQFLAVSGGDNVGFFNIIFKNTHTPISGKGVIDNNAHSGGDSTIAGGWDVENSWFDNNSYAVELGSNSVARNNIMSNNICRGGGNGGTNTVWEYNEFINNDMHNGSGGITDANGNYGMNDPAVNDCGGFKSSTSGDTIRNNLFITNGGAGVGGHGGYPGPGLWFDFGTNATVTNNIFFGNLGPGVLVEARNNPSQSGIASMNITMSGNIFAKNGATAYECGVQSSGANGITVTGNYFITNIDHDNQDCSVGLHARGDDRESNSVPANNTITGNWMTSNVLNWGGGSNNIANNTVGAASGWTIPKIAAGPQK